MGRVESVSVQFALLATSLVGIQTFAVSAYENPVGDVGTAPSANHLQRGSLAGSSFTGTATLAPARSAEG